MRNISKIITNTYLNPYHKYLRRKYHSRYRRKNSDLPWTEYSIYRILACKENIFNQFYSQKDGLKKKFFGKAQYQKKSENGTLEFKPDIWLKMKIKESFKKSDSTAGQIFLVIQDSEWGLEVPQMVFKMKNWINYFKYLWY